MIRSNFARHTQNVIVDLVLVPNPASVAGGQSDFCIGLAVKFLSIC